ncbi:UDP-N-acetylmuramoylalanyl-D-glutamyl-2,6-diaminopimelate--D-alanyl-D-alanine ligase [Telmatospirillum sp. J64-1]|uniref:UDP-N-acetylmuramoylalanyl-D-glutamyl-2, 6-diaminopimelate--D-alanyl-D-alanine ligase n=1 Tax=Telmatospirillum sp. J64-1 TaxID=2502183 RepID=UPI00115D4422|nr:UDP-N-acetylmuramoylalanyl-D-glutamyl-2,6-diaminopimelate--D-alanyl-D-alanine ligase [Telmatospirillum sp. J64-1]
MSADNLWTADEAAQAVHGDSQAAWSAGGVAIDSRAVQPGDLFIALQGPNFDGHAFVAKAFEAGAAAAMVHAVPEGLPAGAPLLRVEDTMTGLQALGGAGRARSKARIVAVTGSVGKTSTKEMLGLALSDQGLTHFSLGSLNNHWGVPLSLSRMPRDTRFGVFEIGMNHAGEISPLTRMVRPHVAIVTTVEAVHLEHFASVAEIADAKAEIFEGLEPGGTAVLNRDNPWYDRLAAACAARGVTILPFGADEKAEARLLDCVIGAEGSDVATRIGGKEIRYRLNVAGRQWVQNSLAVLAAIHALGADAGQAAASLAKLSAPKGRGQRHKLAANVELIDESYNASPVSMRAAIATLAAARPVAAGRRIAVLGDMLELGEKSASLHAGLAESLREAGIDLVFTAGALMERLYETLPPQLRGAHAPDSATLAPQVTAALGEGDVVMVKGSAGSRMGRVVEAIQTWSSAQSGADRSFR